jgi:A/G-specific adenine glycosylase
MAWYQENRRDLPWRRTPNPYFALVSEAMLQQTQVDRVIPRFAAFVDRWPTVGDLASAERAEVVAAWSGLGYNARAVRLHEAACLVARDGWPSTPTDLQQLPGVGPYTAAAIASIAFGVTVPAVDTNLKRVLSRWAGEPLSGASLAAFAAESVVEPSGDWNQAMMDLGAGPCRPRSPRCGDCPVAGWCADPTVYQPPPAQSRFEGSNRQLRGALVRAHVEGRDLVEAGSALGRTDSEVTDAVQNLIGEGLLPSSAYELT